MKTIAFWAYPAILLAAWLGLAGWTLSAAATIQPSLQSIAAAAPRRAEGQRTGTVNSTLLMLVTDGMRLGVMYGLSTFVSSSWTRSSAPTSHRFP